MGWEDMGPFVVSAELSVCESELHLAGFFYNSPIIMLNMIVSRYFTLTWTMNKPVTSRRVYKKALMSLLQKYFKFIATLTLFINEPVVNASAVTGNYYQKV